MFGRIDAQGRQGFQVQFLAVGGIGFEDDLVLEELVDPVGILQVATVLGTLARFDVGHLPRLRAEAPQDATGTVEEIPTYCDVCFWKCGAIAYLRDEPGADRAERAIEELSDRFPDLAIEGLGRIE